MNGTLMGRTAKRNDLMNHSNHSVAEFGMTLVEIMISLVIFAIVIGALSTILFSSTRLGANTSQRAEVQGACRQALSLMTTELRHAGADPRIPPIGVVGIVYADSVSIHVRGDRTGNGVIETTEPSEDVTYSFVDSTNTLTRDPGAGAVPVLRNITDMRLTYFDASGAALTGFPLSTTDAALVQSIGVAITGREGDAAPFTLTSRVMLRNR